MHSSYSHKNLFRHLLRPARGGAAGVVLVFAVLYWVALHAGFIGIPLALLLTSWFFKYAYILFDHTVRGFDEPPTLDINMVNPVDEQRPLGQVAIIALLLFAIKLTADHIGVPAASLLAVLVAFFLPASIAILGLEGNLLKAAYPVAWVQMIKGLGILYAVVLWIIALDLGILGLLFKLGLWLPLEIAVAMFAVLSIFSLLAGALYERRHELELDTWHSPEKVEEKDRLAELRASEKLVTDAYGLMRANAHVKCWETLQSWLAARGFEPEDYRWLCEHVVSWDDPRYITRLTEDYVDRLLVTKQTGRALDIVAKRLQLDAAFRPKTAADTLAMAQMAARGGGSPSVARILLTDFPTRFPGDPRVPIAAELAAHLGPSRNLTL